jgi:hypothetical protein
MIPYLFSTRLMKKPCSMAALALLLALSAPDAGADDGAVALRALNWHSTVFSSTSTHSMKNLCVRNRVRS